MKNILLILTILFSVTANAQSKQRAVIGGVGGSGGTDTVIQTLTDSTTIIFNANNGKSASVTLGGNRTLAISNMANGSFLSLLIIQDNIGSRTITLPSCKVIAGGASSVTLTTTVNAQDILTFWKINNILYCNYGKNYN